MKKKLTKLTAATVLAGSLGAGAMVLDSEPAGAAANVWLWGLACELAGGDFDYHPEIDNDAYCVLDDFVYEW